MKTVSKLITLLIPLMCILCVNSLASDPPKCTRDHSAAGVLPYAKIGGKIHLLLGHEPKRRYWTDFVGKREPVDCNAVETAAREIAEESRLAYPVSEILPELLKSTPVKVNKGRVYIWLIEVVAIDADEISYYPNIEDSEKDTYCWMPLDRVLYAIDSGDEHSTFPPNNCPGSPCAFYNKFRNNLIKGEKIRGKLDALMEK